MKALITGATSGIGRDMAFLLSCKGYDLILASRDTEKMEELQRRLKTNVEIITVDLSREEDCYDLYDVVKDENIHILINNAGYGYNGDFMENSLAADMNMLGLNVAAVHILTKLFLGKFKEKNKGYIMNVASMAGFLPGPLMTTYYATKSYVLRFSQGIYEELRRDNTNVHVCVLCPGPVNTGFNQRAGAEFAINGLESLDVAKIALKGMFDKKAVIIPGALMKIMYLGTKIANEEILMKVVYHIQCKKKERKEK